MVSDLQIIQKFVKLSNIFSLLLFRLSRPEVYSSIGPKDRPHSISDIVLANEYLRHRLYKMCSDVRAIARRVSLFMEQTLRIFRLF